MLTACLCVCLSLQCAFLVALVINLALNVSHYKTMKHRLEWCREMQRSLATGHGRRVTGKAALMHGRDEISVFPAILQDLVFLVHRGFLHVCCENALSLSIFAEFSNLFGHFQFSALALRFSRSQTSTPANFATFECAVGSLVFLCFFMLSRLAWTAKSLLRCRRDDSTDHSRIVATSSSH